KMVPARMGGTVVQAPEFQGNIAGSDRNEDGSPTGYPLWENDHGLTVLRFDDMTNASSPKPLATYVNYAEHGESLEGYDLITADSASSGGVHVDSPFSANVNPTVTMLTHWVAGPLSHPYPSVGNCRTGNTIDGDPGVPAAGLPDCARSGDNVGVTLPVTAGLW